MISSGISIYAVIYSLMLIMITVIFIGDSQLYKTDNAFIFFQFLYFSLLSMDLSATKDKDLYRFLFGFRIVTGNILNI